MLVVLVGLEGDQHQRHHLEGAKSRAQSQNRRGRTGEVKVVEGAEDAARQKDRRGEEHRRGGRGGLDQAHAGEEEGDDGRGEDLEEALHPQVHHPPAPVLGDRQVGLAIPHQPGGVEERDGRRRQQEQPQQVLRLGGLLEGRPHGPDHQAQPEEQAHEQKHLPEAAQIDVLVALVAEPEVGRVGQALLGDGEPLAGHRARHDDQQTHEEEVHAQALELGLVAGHRRGDVEARRQPGRRDPEDAQLRVPGARHRVGQHLVDRDAVEGAAFDAVVGRHDAHEHLRHYQGAHHPEVLERGPHRGRGARVDGRVALGHHVRVVVAVLALVNRVVPGQRADAGQQEHEADHRPQDHRAGRDVVDQRLGRPVAGVGDRLAGPVGGRGPGGPEEEGVHVGHALGIAHGVRRHGVGLAKLLHGRVVAEQRGVVAAVGRDGGRALGADRDRAGGRIIGVGADVALQPGAQGGLLLVGELGVRLAEVAVGPAVEHEHELAVQPVRVPVRRDVGAVAPDRADLLAAHRLPDVLAVFDVLAREEHATVGGDDALRNRWRDPVYFPAIVAEHGKRGDHDADQPCPQLAVIAHLNPRFQSQDTWSDQAPIWQQSRVAIGESQHTSRGCASV
ncbi:hypothetical protein D3C72_891780 [compost metagenome]